jgi:hypothetical protein
VVLTPRVRASAPTEGHCRGDAPIRSRLSSTRPRSARCNVS